MHIVSKILKSPWEVKRQLFKSICDPCGLWSEIDREFQHVPYVPSLSLLWCCDLCVVYHGTDGPVIVDDMSSTLLADKFVLAGQELGFEHIDVTAQKQFGT